MISSLDMDVYKIINQIHAFNGIAILAHVMAKKYGIYEVYHGIPADLDYDGIEVTSIRDLKKLKKSCLHLKDEYIFLIAMLIT